MSNSPNQRVIKTEARNWQDRPSGVRLAHTGLIAIPVASLAALAVMPPNPSGEGDLMLSAWLMAAGLLAGMVGDVIFNGIRAVFRTEHIVIVGMITIIFPELLQPSYSTGQSVEVIRKTFAAIGLFGTSLAFGCSFNPGRLPHSLLTLASRRYSSGTLLGIIFTCWSLAMISYAAPCNFSPTVMLGALGADRWNAPWARGQFGGWDSFRDFLVYFGYPVPALTVVIQNREKSWTRPNVLMGLFCSASFLPFPVQGGGRRVIVLILGAALLTWLCANRHYLKVRHYVAFATISLAMVIALDVMLVQRQFGFANFQYTQDDFKGLRVDDNFDALAETVRIFPDELNYLQHNFIWYVIVRPIPRVLWEGKPVNGGFDLASYRGLHGLSLSNSIVGELYMSYGWIAIIAGGILLGRLARTWSQLLVANYGITGLALYSLGTMCLFVGIRSMIELVLLSYPILCWWALDFGVHSRVGRAAVTGRNNVPALR